MMTDVGVPRHLAEGILLDDIQARPRGSDFRAPQIAEALGLPLFSIHTPADYHMLHFLQDLVKREEVRTLGDLVDAVKALPEVQYYCERHIDPEVLAVGDRKRYLGPVYIVGAGGWNPTPRAMEALCDAGVGTLLMLAASEELREIARRHHAAIVIVPHFPADDIGLNLFLDTALQHADFEIVPCSNFFRVQR
jgi:hypothetical protein